MFTDTRARPDSSRINADMAVAEKGLNVIEMTYLRSMCGVTCMDRVRNEEVRRKTGVTTELAS